MIAGENHIIRYRLILRPITANGCFYETRIFILMLMVGKVCTSVHTCGTDTVNVVCMCWIVIPSYNTALVIYMYIILYCKQDWCTRNESVSCTHAPHIVEIPFCRNVTPLYFWLELESLVSYCVLWLSAHKIQMATAASSRRHFYSSKKPASEANILTRARCRLSLPCTSGRAKYDPCSDTSYEILHRRAPPRHRRHWIKHRSIGTSDATYESWKKMDTW